MQGPLYENTPEHLCVGSQLRARFDKMHPDLNDKNQIKRNKMLLFEPGDSNMYYDAYCNGATFLKNSTFALLVAYAALF